MPMKDMLTADHANRHYLLATCGDPWAVEPLRMRAYLNTLIVSDMEADEIELRTGPRGAGLVQGVAVLPLHGPIAYRSGLFTAFFGGTSVMKWRAVFDDLLASDAVGAIVIDSDSPGGSVEGVPELAEHIYKSRGTKPIIAVANTWMASAAYWIGSAADELVVVPSGEAGSIGVWSMHVDYSKAYEEMGIGVTLISAGKYKIEGNPYEPLGEEARASIQTDVDHYYKLFTEAVAKHRGATPKAVRDGYGQGRMLTAKKAVETGLADRVATFDSVLRGLSRQLGRAQAEARAAELRLYDGKDGE